MKYLTLFILVTLPFSLFSNEKLLILEEIQKSIISDYQLSSTNQTITVIETTPSQGEQRVQQLLKKNRQKIQKQNGASSGKTLSGKEKIAQMLQKNRDKLKAQQAIAKSESGKSDWISKKMREQNNWHKKRKIQIATWEAKKKEILAKWYAERQKYLKRVPDYKKDLAAIPAPAIPQKKLKRITKKIPPLSNYHLVKNAFTGEPKDQGKRPTCAAFAGVRAIEILLAQNGNYKPLSEQYFFWASLPECQKRPCGHRGSWVKYEYDKSSREGSPDIPLLSDYPYRPAPAPNNVNYTPLPSICNKKKKKIERYNEVISAKDIIEELKKDRPVVAGFKLSKNFYYNKGYVFLNKKLKFKVKLDQHSAGHAVLLVGYMKLPKELHQSEGKFCFITANSWGTGWGKGGHACISEKWFHKYRFEIPFIALEKVSV